MKPRSELNPGVWQGDCFPVLIRIARKCFGDRECRCWYSGGQTLIALRIGQKFRTRRLALHALPMRRATAVRNRPDKARRRLFRLGRDRVEFERCCLTRRRGDRTASQRRLTLGWKADQRSVRRIPQRGLVVCWACSAVWRCKSSGQPDGGEGLVR